MEDLLRKPQPPHQHSIWTMSTQKGDLSRKPQKPQQRQPKKNQREEMLCRSRKKTKMKRSSKETMRSEVSLRRAKHRERRKTLTERIEQEDQKTNQTRKGAKRRENIQQILEEFRSIKSISCIKYGRKITLIPKVKNDSGETITSRKGIANVFGELPKLSLEKKHKSLKTWKQKRTE